MGGSLVCALGTPTRDVVGCSAEQVSTGLRGCSPGRPCPDRADPSLAPVPWPQACWGVGRTRSSGSEELDGGPAAPGAGGPQGRGGGTGREPPREALAPCGGARAYGGLHTRQVPAPGPGLPGSLVGHGAPTTSLQRVTACDPTFFIHVRGIRRAPAIGLYNHLVPQFPCLQNEDNITHFFPPPQFL